MSDFVIIRKRARTFLLPFITLLLVSWMVVFFGSCRYYKLEQQLDPVNKDWLNRVRYIITKEESHMYLDIPEEEREQFKEDFWKRRDPDPNTEENEFQMEYFNRMDQADDLFTSEGKPGWMTDRGRIYILFGPPLDRITYPMGYSASGRCQEVWYYGNFPVVFVDNTCTGTYRLMTYDLTSIRSYNLMYMHELSSAQARAQQTIRGRIEDVSFDWGVDKTMDTPDRVEGTLLVKIPYGNIWFTEEGSKLVTTLELRLELKDSEDNIVWEHEDSYRIETDEEGLEDMKGKKYEIEIPFVLEEKLPQLRKGKNRLYGFLTNTTGGDTTKKVKEFNL
jgi:GWxTD domain-containing protein